MNVTPIQSIERARVLGVFGDSQTLVMHVCRPARTVGSPTNDALFGSGDLKSVSYYLGGPDGQETNVAPRRSCGPRRSGA